MKKILFLFLIPIILFSCRQSQKSELKGNIESIKELVHGAEEKFGESVKGELNEVWIDKLNDKNLVIEKILYDEDGDEMSRWDFSYNDRDELILLKSAHSYGETFIQELIEIDKYKKTYTQKHTYKDIISIDTIYEHLDQNGHSSKSILKKSGGSQSESYYTYAKNGDLLEGKWLTDDGDISQWEKHEYDGNRMLIKTNILYMYGSAQNDSILYEYKLDDKSNWIERIKRENGKVSQITEREITYRK